MSEWTLTMQAGSWRGESAYETACRYGFAGTEEEWLESLHGADGAPGGEVSVNGKTAVDGAITLRGEDIPLAAGLSQTLYRALEDKLNGPLVDDLTTGGRGSALSAQQGKVLSERLDGKIRALCCDLLPGAWMAAEEGGFRCSVSLPGITGSGILICAPDPADGYTAWCECGVRCVLQAEGLLTFAAEELPGERIRVQLCRMSGGAAEESAEEEE